MTETPAGLLLFGVIFLLLLFIAIFAAIIVYVGKAQDKNEAPSSAAFPPSETASTPPLEEPEPEVEQPARPGEVMRVIRDRETGRVLVEVDGQRYTHLREIRDAGVGRRVLWAIADLVRFTGGMATNPQAVQHAREAEGSAASGATSLPPGVRPAVSPGPPASNRSPSSGASAPRLSDLASPGTTAPPASQQGYSLMGFFRRGFQAPPPAEAVPSPTNFVEEIDDILQRMVRELPAPPSQPVRVTSGEGGMLQIIVGIQTYHSADEVPDLEIRRLIQAAVAEWEAS
jgi:hypothetical protein